MSDLQPMKRRAQTDGRTGREVWKLTDWDDVNCGATYFYLQCLSADERYLVFCCDREGVWAHYRLKLSTGEVVKVPGSEGRRPDGGRHWVAFHPNGREFFEPSKDGGIDAVDVETFERRPLMKPPTDPKVTIGGGLRFADGGRLLVVMGKNADGNASLLVAEGEGVEAEEVFRWNDPDKVFCHLLAPETGPAVCTFDVLPDQQDDAGATRAQRARNWKLDLRSGEAEPFLVMPPGERATHEYWSVTGAPRLFYHRKTVGTWVPASIDSVDLNGGDHQRHFESDTLLLGHSMMSPCGRYLVTDVQQPNDNPLILIDLRDGTSQTLCWPNTSAIKNETGHVHPLFSPSGQDVVYTGDEDGKAAVYLVPGVITPGISEPDRTAQVVSK